MDYTTDIMIVGSGVAGLFCALNLPANLKVTVLTKDKARRSDSFLAQGGICVEADDCDYESYFEDTLKAGHYENNPDAVDIMIRSSREVVGDLIGYDVEFAQSGGEYLYTKEGGHSKPRILFHEDITGEEIMSKLLQQVFTRKNIEIREYETMIDIMEKDNTCYGVVTCDNSGTINHYSAKYTVFACGGVGGLFQFSTNFRHLTGDAIAIALEHGILTEHVDYIQIHPTAFYDPASRRCMLISESVRGEGAYLLSAGGERFVDELQPRDVVTKAILAQMEKDKMPYVRLAMQHLGEEKIKAHFPHIYEFCLEKGIDVRKDCIPVVPAQHYMMGGIKVDMNSASSMQRLYAIGETSCNGVHGANRLASNSLLESLVFAKRAAQNIVDSLQTRTPEMEFLHGQDVKYSNVDQLMAHYKDLVLKKIEVKEHE